MRKITNSTALIIAALFTYSFFSCQPEVPPYNPTTRADSTTTVGTQLTRYVITNGGDSTALNYTYNNAKQVIGIELLETGSGTHYFYSYTRNTAGLITRCIYTYLTNNVPSPDTATVDFSYGSGTNPNLTVSVERLRSPGNNRTDSTLYSYNAAGQCTVMNNYVLDAISPTAYYLQDRTTFSYNSTGDIAQYILYVLNNGQLSVQDTSQLSYDNKSPFITLTAADKLILYQELPYANHNITQFLYRPAPRTGYPTATSVVTHTYNSRNLPVTSKIVQSENGILTDSSFLKYYYQ